jgi:hypothetical protein
MVKVILKADGVCYNVEVEKIEVANAFVMLSTRATAKELFKLSIKLKCSFDVLGECAIMTAPIEWVQSVRWEEAK